MADDIAKTISIITDDDGDFSWRTYAREIFKDPNGQPRLFDAAVVFVDALGTSEASTGPNAGEHLLTLHQAIEFAATRSLIDDPLLFQYTTWFTDNAVAALPVAFHQGEEDAAYGASVVAAEFSVALLEHGILSRGGIALGPSYIDDRFAFGPALITAHELETKAVYPRFLIDNRVRELLTNPTIIDIDTLDSQDPIPRTVRRDGNLWFIDQFDISFGGRGQPARERLASSLTAAVQDGLVRTGANERAHQKWLWAQERLSNSISRFCPDFDIPGAQ